MKISELIAKLTELQGEVGDVQVRSFGPSSRHETGAEGPVNSVIFCPETRNGVYPDHVEICHDDEVSG